MAHQTQRRHLGTAGSVSVAHVTTLGLAAAGILAVSGLGATFATAIDSEASGERGVAVSAQAGESREHDAGPVAVAAATGEPAPVSTVGAEGTSDDWFASDGELGAAAGAANVGSDWRGDCGWNPFCHGASLTSRFIGDNLSRAGHWVSERVGDIPVLGPALRFIGGTLDGLWDGLFDIARGLKEAVESVLWDFVAEDLIGGTVSGFAGVACKVVTLGNACHGSSWNPIKSTTDSLWNFGKGVWNSHHLIGEILHQASLCTNPWNGQSAEDRGHACGGTLTTIADLVFAAKGVGKIASATRASRAGAAVEATTLADDAVRAGDGLADDAARCAGGVCLPGTGACFTAGTPVDLGDKLKAIEEIAVGERVETLAVGAEAATDVRELAGYLRYEFELPNPEVPGTVVEITTLRPAGTFDESLVGSTTPMRIEFPEWGIRGEAFLSQVTQAPVVEVGAGFAVLSTFRRESSDVYELALAETNERIEPTGSHRFWSTDRGEWVATKDLRVGERLRTENGTATLAGLERKPGTHPVFNLEIDAEHTYLVGRTGLFTHNICVGDEVFVPRSDGTVSAAKVLEVIDEHSVRVEVRTPHGPGWKIVRTDSLRAFSADTAIGARTGLGDVVRAPNDDLLVRRPGDAGNSLDDAYRAAHEGARADFYEYFTSGEAITAERLAEQLRRLHGDVAADYRGNGGLPVNPGRFHTEPGLASGSPLRRADVAGELQRAGFSADEIANLTAEGPVRVRGIADGQLPRNAQGRHFYPGAADHGAYLEAAARRLETLRTMPLNKTAFADELADYYHTLVNGRFFGQVNNSLWMDQVNSLLRSVGHPGIPHGQLDFVALTLDYESFRRVFREALREGAK